MTINVEVMGGLNLLAQARIEIDSPENINSVREATKRRICSRRATFWLGACTSELCGRNTVVAFWNGSACVLRAYVSDEAENPARALWILKAHSRLDSISTSFFDTT
jgi:hypothetical protein